MTRVSECFRATVLEHAAQALTRRRDPHDLPFRPCAPKTYPQIRSPNSKPQNPTTNLQPAQLRQSSLSVLSGASAVRRPACPDGPGRGAFGGARSADGGNPHQCISGARACWCEVMAPVEGTWTCAWEWRLQFWDALRSCRIRPRKWNWRDVA